MRSVRPNEITHRDTRLKTSDIIFAVVLVAIICLFAPLSVFTGLQQAFLFNKSYWLLTSFLKFAALASMGEMLVLRLKTGYYVRPGSGVTPRAVIWGLLGISIKIAFETYSSGVPALLQNWLGVSGAVASMQDGITPTRVLTAFAISGIMNVTFGPVMMTVHKIADTHITDNEGSFKSFVRPLRVKSIFGRINWQMQWDFVYKKTIPLFWIPAHTVVFMTPPQYRIALAALLSIVLGLLLAIASRKTEKPAKITG